MMMMMMMMIISAIALERHQPFDQRTIADIRLIVICILPRAFCQSVIHFQKIRENLFCLKISFTIIRFRVYLCERKATSIGGGLFSFVRLLRCWKVSQQD